VQHSADSSILSRLGMGLIYDKSLAKETVKEETPLGILERPTTNQFIKLVSNITGILRDPIFSVAALNCFFASFRGPNRPPVRRPMISTGYFAFLQLLKSLTDSRRHPRARPVALSTLGPIVVNLFVFSSMLRPRCRDLPGLLLVALLSRLLRRVHLVSFSRLRPGVK
jgi:hypothetical protein